MRENTIISSIYTKTNYYRYRRRSSSIQYQKKDGLVANPIVLDINRSSPRYYITKVISHLSTRRSGYQKKPLIRSKTEKITLPQNKDRMSSYLGNKQAFIVSLVLTRRRSTTTQGLPSRHTIKARLETSEGSSNRTGLTTPQRYNSLIISSNAR